MTVMTPKEAIERLERLQEREPWEPQIDSEMWQALEMGIEALDYMEFMSHQHSCNDCGWKTCKYKPKWGEAVRINCYQWRK